MGEIVSEHTPLRQNGFGLVDQTIPQNYKILTELYASNHRDGSQFGGPPVSQLLFN